MQAILMKKLKNNQPFTKILYQINQSITIKKKINYLNKIIIEGKECF